MRTLPCRRGFLAIFASYLAFSFLSTVYTIEATSGIDSSLYVPGEILITFTDQCAPDPSEVSSHSPAAFGQLEIDTVIAALGIQMVSKVVPPTENPIGEASRRIDRMYVLMFDTTLSVASIIDSLSSLPCIERMSPNWVVPVELLGTKRYEPQGTQFGRQWYLDTLVVGDYLDIDAPEAWSIQRGDTNVIIGILDTGTMVDTSSALWRLHNDLDFHWITEEDWASPGILDGDDIRCGLNYSDDNGDSIRDNIIGQNFAKAFKCLYPPTADCPPCQNPNDQYRAAFWRGIPQNWQLEFNQTTGPANPISWEVVAYAPHGVRVASIAAAKLEGDNIVGTAHGCRIYVLRNYYAIAVSDFVAMIDLAAQVCDVINMSWWVQKDANGDFEDAIERAASQWDCVMVAATGNDATTHGVRFPAREPEVLSVGAIARDGDLTYYSSWEVGAELVDIVAPVDNGIWAASHTECLPVPCGPTENTKKTGIGTSYAAPQATGVAALLRARFPGMSQSDVRTRIKRSAQFRWANTATNRQMYGSGKLNAYRALTEWGSIASDQTWTANTLPPYFDTQGSVWVSRPGSRDGNYYLSGDLVIEQGATLTIEPGDTIRVAPDHEATGMDTLRTEFVVKGVLRAIGSPSQPVVFESYNDSAPGNDDWVGIRFEPGSSAVLKNVIIRNASDPIVVEEFGIAVSDWNQTKTLYLHSDHTITADFTVAEEESLFVLGDSEVTVTGGSGVDITVDGTLIARGSATKKPTFRSTTAQRSSWGPLTLTASSENNVFHNVVFQDANQAIRSFVALAVDSCSFTNGTDGVQSHAGLTVTNSTFSDLTASAVAVADGNLLADGIEAYDCGYGVVASPNAGTISCSSSYLHDLGWRGIQVAVPSGGVTVKHTTIEDVVDGIYLADQATAALIDSCTIRRADIGVSVVDTMIVSIRHSVVDACTTTGVFVAGECQVALEADTASNSPVGLFLISNTDGTIGANTLISNNALGLKCELGSDPIVRDTRITANGSGVAAIDNSSPDLGQATGGACGSGSNDGSNSIHNHTSHHVVNLDPGITVMAECNWWGFAGPKASKFSGAVDYTPYLGGDPNPVSPNSQPPPPDDAPGPKFPKSYALGEGRPNPFNPTITLPYAVPAPGGKVTIVIYDVRGARVRVVVQTHRVAGWYEAQWDGRDEKGREVTSGVYFVKMTAHAFAATRKVVLLK